MTARGFTLIELMIVIAIVAVIASIAIPNLIEARKGSNEAAAIGAIRTISTAQTLFRESDPDHKYAADLGQLQTALPQLIDDPLSHNLKQGYLYILAVDPDRSHFTATGVPAAPRGPNRTGDRCFFVDETGVIRATTTASDTPNASSSPLNN